MCGDPWQGPRMHEAGYPGGYANGEQNIIYLQAIPLNCEKVKICDHMTNTLDII